LTKQAIDRLQYRELHGAGHSFV